MSSATTSSATTSSVTTSSATTSSATASSATATTTASTNASSFKSFSVSTLWSLQQCQQTVEMFLTWVKGYIQESLKLLKEVSEDEMKSLLLDVDSLYEISCPELFKDLLQCYPSNQLMNRYLMTAIETETIMEWSMKMVLPFFHKYGQRLKPYIMTVFQQRYGGGEFVQDYQFWLTQPREPLNVWRRTSELVFSPPSPLLLTSIPLYLAEMTPSQKSFLHCFLCYCQTKKNLPNLPEHKELTIRSILPSSSATAMVIPVMVPPLPIKLTDEQTSALALWFLHSCCKRSIYEYTQRMCERKFDLLKDLPNLSFGTIRLIYQSIREKYPTFNLADEPLSRVHETHLKWRRHTTSNPLKMTGAPAFQTII